MHTHTQNHPTAFLQSSSGSLYTSVFVRTLQKVVQKDNIRSYFQQLHSDLFI